MILCSAFTCVHVTAPSEVPPLLHWKSMFPGLVGPSDIWEVNAQQFGSAVAWASCMQMSCWTPASHRMRARGTRSAAKPPAGPKRKGSLRSTAGCLRRLWRLARGMVRMANHRISGARKQAWKLATEAVRRKSEEAGHRTWPSPCDALKPASGTRRIAPYVKITIAHC